MNGTIEIKSQTSNVQYEYKTSTFMIQGAVSKDALSDQLQSINGSCYRLNEQGGTSEFFGNFNGYMSGDSGMRYSVSEMSRRDALAVWDAIDEIEAHFSE
jgi:hypothetical protein